MGGRSCRGCVQGPGTHGRRPGPRPVITRREGHIMLNVIVDFVSNVFDWLVG
ncbi:hypothetical protein I5Q34_14905 [Streptomyces sp. AV19]|uniref:hypothetical protein n=1 Tax=Streptomyces sp. AV19 TaxID=2793068 RepID=UPI0018FE4027|nr:hypothetical protein [Streptomyces sp. AV19]MBH1935544.1 hypothetical protein [Streptomyces sp. AV19]MDG4534433.1 hypothetical protein [Streptomyces sp. AV19]